MLMQTHSPLRSEGMKQSTLLSSAVFRLTPTRTRCDLIIIAIDKKEKIASGLLNPFIAHLKTARDQIALGGYSILLEPEKSSNAAWFTKATLERFVRFVSTPEILERVYTIENEILQIEEAITTQRSAENTVENHGKRFPGGYKALIEQANEEKAIVLYTPGPIVSEAKRSYSPERNSRVQFLKVLESRKTMLQKEQEMAFARAVAAGFDIDYMAHLVSFSECFGAMRLMDACWRFTDLWKSKHEKGQCLNIEASESEALLLSDTLNKHDDPSHELSSMSYPISDNPFLDCQQEYFQGQFPNLVFPPWHMEAPPVSHPVFPAYPPYYQAYTGNIPFFQPHRYHMEQSSNFGPNLKQEYQSEDVGNSNGNSNDTGSEMKEVDRTRPLDDMASDAEVSSSQKLNKETGGSEQIQNIDCITSKEKISDGEANSDSASENEYSEGNDVIHQTEKDTDNRHWLAFQDCLLRDRSNESVREIPDDTMGDVDKIDGSMSHELRTSDNEVMFSTVGNDDDQTDIQLAENDERKTLSGTTEEDSASGNQQNWESLGDSLDPLAANISDSNEKDEDYYPHRMSDDEPIDIDYDILTKHLESEENAGYEPNDLSWILERETDRRTNGYSSDLEYEMQDCAVEKGKKNVTDVKEGNSDKNRISSLHKQRTRGPVRKTKPSKMSPLEDVQVHAESSRSYKADMQKLKKEQKVVEPKRHESLKMKRQKKTAARASSNSARPSISSPQTKLSPTANRVSKFSDSEHGSSSSPLQRSRIRISDRSSEPNKASMVGNRFTRSPSSSSPENSIVPMSRRTRRLSEQKININSPDSTAAKAEPAVLKRKLPRGTERNKISAIKNNRNRSKAATLPELKVKASKSSRVSIGEDLFELELQEDKEKFPETSELNVNDDSDDNSIPEKPVLLLENEKKPSPSFYGDKGEKSNVTTSELVPVHAPPPMNVSYKEAITCSQDQSDHDDVRTVYSEKDALDFSSSPAHENLYQAHHDRVSSFEDPCTHNTYYDEGQLGSSELLSRAEETVKNQANSEKLSFKEPSKSFRRFLRFGKRNHTSSSVNQIIDSEEFTGGNGIKHENNGPKVASTSEVATLKNLISEEKTSAPGNAPRKSTRRFSLFSHLCKKSK